MDLQQTVSLKWANGSPFGLDLKDDFQPMDTKLYQLRDYMNARLREWEDDVSEKVAEYVQENRVRSFLTALHDLVLFRVDLLTNDDVRLTYGVKVDGQLYKVG